MDTLLIKKSSPVNKILFYRGYSSCPVIDMSGEYVEDAWEGLTLDMLNVFTEKELPKDGGFYMWEGTIEWKNFSCPIDPPEYSPEWIGCYRIAKKEDFVNFNIILPC